ncbi:hypothetical protein E2C01_027618 [Portunus trituberculatus]|uniref:Uncharacterized protein n=1 Tax=Portunus trituberculatus TaxID=210409 RepID=A0A5B7ELD0_PORTR|nr:hypothetical protein [Portunus trituberculatus]
MKNEKVVMSSEQRGICYLKVNDNTSESSRSLMSLSVNVVCHDKCASLICVQGASWNRVHTKHCLRSHKTCTFVVA